MSGEQLAVDFVGSDGPYYGQRGFWGRIVLKLIVVYLLIAFWSWEELRYRAAGIEVPGEAVKVGPARKNLISVRYTFRDPISGIPRHNTVAIPESLFPESGKASIQFLPGENPQSRLLNQARPNVVRVFVGINVVLGLAVTAFLGCIAWEANRPYVTPQGRMVAAYRRKHEPQQGWLDRLKSRWVKAK